MATIIAPVRYAAWLAGQLGDDLLKGLNVGLSSLPSCHVQKLPRGFHVAADEEPGILLEAVASAMADLESCTQEKYPVFHHEMGPVWTGTLQAVFNRDASTPT